MAAPGDRGAEDVHMRRQKRRVEPAPRVPDDADALRIDDAHLHDPFHARRDAFDDRQARFPRTEHDVGLEDSSPAS